MVGEHQALFEDCRCHSWELTALLSGMPGRSGAKEGLDRIGLARAVGELRRQGDFYGEDGVEMELEL